MQLNRSALFSAVISAFLFSNCANQPAPPTTVELDMVITDSVPFKTIYASAMFDSTKTLQLDGIDSLATYKIYLDDPGIDILRGAFNPLKDYVLCVSGVSQENKKRVVLLDTDNDGNVADEIPHFIDKNPPYIPIKNVQYREGGTIKTNTFYVKPHINREMVVSGRKRKKHRNEVDNLGALVLPTYHYGTLKTDEGAYKFALFNYYRNDYTAETAFLSIVPDGGPFLPPTASPVYYQQDDVIYLGKKGFRFNGMKKDGSQISLEQLDGNVKNVGADSGLYAIPIQSIDIRSGKKYNLSNANQYTVLDFWGTWCGPCLKMLPELQAFDERRDQYNFQLVSIAYDADPKKVRDHILQQGIYWTNLFDDQNNSVITDKYKVTIFPTFILIDKNGKILYRGAGEEALKNIESILKRNQ